MIRPSNAFTRAVAVGSVLLATTGASRAAAPTDERTQGSAELESPDAYLVVLERARSLYGARKYEEARDAFDSAARLAPTDGDRATLFFNAAVAALEALDYTGAERRFVQSKTLDPTSNDLCSIQAAFAALRRGDLPAAAGHRAQISRTPPPDVQGDLDALDGELEEAMRASRVAHRQETLERARKAYADKRLSDVRRETARFFSDAADATREELVFAELLNAYVAHDRGEATLAERSYRRALELDEGAIDAYVGLGDLRAARGDRDEALALYESGLRHAQTPRDRTRLSERILALHPLPEERLSLFGRFDLGWDSNAAQSGSARTTGFAAVSRTESAFAQLALFGERPFRLGRTSRLSPFYSANATFLLDPAVSDYSLQGHEAGLLWSWSWSPKTLLRIGASGDVYLVGLEAMAPFLADASLSATLSLEHSRLATSRFALNGRRSFGLEGRDSLTGFRSDFEFREFLRLGTFSPVLTLALVSYDLGTSFVPLRDLSLPLCDSRAFDTREVCSGGAVYRIPLAYRSLALGIGTDWDPTRRFRLGASLRLEARRYIEESGILVDPGGPFVPPGPTTLAAKRRVDLRAELRATATLTLDERGAWAIPLDYWLLVSRSNMAEDPSDPEHALDYDNRNFEQHVLSLGVRYLY